MNIVKAETTYNNGEMCFDIITDTVTHIIIHDCGNILYNTIVYTRPHYTMITIMTLAQYITCTCTCTCISKVVVTGCWLYSSYRLESNKEHSLWWDTCIQSCELQRIDNHSIVGDIPLTVLAP